MDEHAITLRPPVWALLLAVVIGGGFYVAGKHLETKDRTPVTISVSGEGRVFSTPDIAEVSVGIQTGRQKTAKVAMEKLEETMAKVFEAVKSLGVEEKDIRTEHFWLNPVYDWTDGGQVFRGFEATQSLRVKVRDLDKASDVLSAATNAGANQAGGVQFTIDDPEKLRAEARQKAIDQAKEKAQTLAGELGMRLGKLKGFSEGGGGWPAPMMMRADYGVGGAMEAMDKSLPLPPGEQEINAVVSITYELK